MRIKVTVNTPAKQAAGCMNSNKAAILGYSESKKITEEVLVSDSQFYWVLDIEEKELEKVISNAARGEIIIKKFYNTLFKVIHRCNTLGSKLGKAGAWLKRQMLYRLNKMAGSDKSMSEYINKMSEDELSEMIMINDKEAIQKLLAGKLIDVEVLNEAVPK